MIIFVLKAFETMGYNTHIPFYASSLEQARKLAGEFYDEVIYYLKKQKEFDKINEILDEKVETYTAQLRKEYTPGEWIIKKREISSKCYKFRQEEALKYPELPELRNVICNFDSYALYAFYMEEETLKEESKEETINRLLKDYLVDIKLDKLVFDSYTDGD